MMINKSKRSSTCLLHVCLYTLPFLLLTHSWKALLVIAGTHFIIDRFGIARYLVWVKNHCTPHGYAGWNLCSLTGYFDERTEEDFTVDFTATLNQAGGMVMPPPEFNEKLELLRDYQEAKKKYIARPLFITAWLTIIADNTLHLLCNFLAIKYLS